MNRPAPASFKLAILLTALVAFGPISTDLYLSSLPDMARDLGGGIAQAQTTLSVFLLGFAVGMPVYGPLSDRFGRRPVLLGGVCLYLLGSVACLLAADMNALIASRFVQALGACCGPVVARAVVRDVYPREQAARVMSYMSSAMALAPFVAPMLGGWVHTLFGWRANFGLLAGFGLALLPALWWLLRETNTHPDAQALHPARMAANYRTLLTNGRAMGYMLVVSFVFAGMFSFISASSFVLIEVLGLSPALFGFGFAIVVAGYIVGGLVAGTWTARLGLDRMIRVGVFGCAACGVLAAALAWSGIQTMAAVLLPIMGYFFFSALALPNSTAGAIAPFSRMAGIASALVGMMQMSAGAASGWLHAALFDHTARPLAGLLAAMGSVGLIMCLALVRRR